MRINNNISALNSLSSLNRNDDALSKSLEKLSSGLRINKAADDAAGLAISEKMRGQIKGLSQATRNAQDGISLLQTAEGALNETHSILQRMRELAVQSSNDTLTTGDRNEIQKEMTQLSSEIDRIGNTTQFNTKTLLNGGAGISVTATKSAANLTATGDTQAGTINLTAAQMAKAAAGSVVVGAGQIGGLATTATNLTQDSSITIAGTTLSFNNTNTVQDVLNAFNVDNTALGITATWANGTGLTLKANTTGSANGVNITGAGTGDLAAGAGVANHAGTNATVTGASVTETALGGAGNFTIGGTDGNHIKVTGGNYKGLEFDLSGTLADFSITINSNNALKLQIGANAGQNMSISIGDMRTTALGVNGLDVTTQAAAGAAVTTIDTAIASVSSERSKIGAVQNRLEHTIANLGTASENLSAAESRVRDVDMAQEMSAFTRSQILMQASTAMMAQANQKTQGVLKLLG